MNSIPAVHAMDEFPKDGVLRVRGDQINGFGIGVTRRTLHFALGELVRPHQGLGKQATWDNKSYAVVLPLMALKDQLINLNAYDTFIVGELKIPSQAILIVPKNQANLVPPGIKFHTFDPQITTLREAVDHVVNENSWWSIRMKNNYDGLFQSKQAYLAEATIAGRNINRVDFFGPILRELPYVSFGHHIESQRGNAWRFGKLEQDLSVALLGITAEISELRLKRNLIRFELNKLIESFSGSAPSKLRNELTVLKADLEAWINILNIEIYAREKKGISISLRLEEFIQYRSDPRMLLQKLNQVVESDKDLIKAHMFTRLFTFQSSEYWRSIFDGLPHDEVALLLAANRSLIQPNSPLGELVGRY